MPRNGLIANTVPARFILDGRWLHAFNGPGMTNNAVYGNFRYTGSDLATNPNIGMDEDYDAADLENWFLAMQSADGSVIIPSFHRPSAIRIDYTLARPEHLRLGRSRRTRLWEESAPLNWADSASRILRPRAADGHDAATFPDLLPDATGKITYDVDNDGDGDHRLGLARPGVSRAAGRAGPALQAALLVHGHRPERQDPAQHRRQPGGPDGWNTVSLASGAPLTTTVAARCTPSTWATRSARSTRPTRCRTATTGNYDLLGAFNHPGGTNTAVNTQVDSVGIDVRVTQLRNLLAGIRPPQKTTFGTGSRGGHELRLRGVGRGERHRTLLCSCPMASPTR